MTSRRARCSGLALVALAGAGLTEALDPARPPERYQREVWGAEEGFPGGGVHAITQGRDGYLWVGTEKGLVRFDGREFRLVPDTESAAARDPGVLGVVADASGGVWLRSDRPVLRRHRDGHFESVPFARYEHEVAVTAMTLGRSGGPLLFAQASGLLEWRADRFEPRPLDRVPPSVVLSLAETADGSLFLGTRDTGLFLVRDGRVTALAEGLPDRKVNCLLAVSDREVWVGTDRGVVRWDGTGLTRASVPAELHTAPALTLLRDRDANVWVGTTAGLLRANAQLVAAVQPPAAARSGAVTALFEDREGDLWVGHGWGIERLHDTLFATWTRARGLPSEGGGAIHADGKGRVWFAPPEGGLVSIEGARVESVGLGGDRVYSIAEARDGLWLGRQRGGLTHFRPNAKPAVLRSYTEADGLAQSGVYAVLEARDGSVWAGTLNRGLSRLRDGRFETFTTANGLPANSIGALLESRDGTLWVGTPAGLAAWSGGAWTTRRARDGLPSDNVAALLEDAQGVLWVGTSEGIAFLRSGRIEPPAGAHPALREAVFGLVESEGGWLWVSTARRLLRVRREPLLAGIALQAGDLVSYGRLDGLVGLEGVRRHRSVTVDPRGRIWFATDRGLSMVHPRRALAAPPPPVLHLRSLVADEREAAFGGSDAVRVPPRPQRLRIAYTGVSLQAPERVRFRHRLDGVDADWSEPVASEEAVYANLAPGAYRFRVRAAGADGRWDESEATLSFTILPAAWQTAWFRVLALLALAAGAWLAYRWRLGQATRQINRAFEERLAERTRIARELHDTLLQGFVSASMQLHVAVDQVPEASPARGPLQRVQQVVGQVIEEGRQAVLGLRTVDRDAGDLAQALSQVAEDRPVGDPAALRVIVEGTPRPLHPSVREELYRIGREALVNALRHARAQRIEVELEYARRAVRLLVRDDGVGIDPDILQSGREGHYGLSGMRERAERIGGRLRLLSAGGAGTEIEVVVRGAVAYASPRPARPGWLLRLARWRSRPEPSEDTPARSGGR